jgi:signal transduction histidine kinase
VRLKGFGSSGQPGRVHDFSTVRSQDSVRGAWSCGRVSADIHDGPAQLLALAALRLGSPALAAAGGPEVDVVRGYLDEAMGELRTISRGLALPEIERLPLDRLIAAAVDTHRRRTDRDVAVENAAGEVPLGASERIAVYRFLQETLNNASRHAAGASSAVSVSTDGDSLHVEVRDTGPGFDPEASTDRLGLAGLRDRIESLGGTFALESGPGGTLVSMRLPMSQGGRS